MGPISEAQFIAYGLTKDKWPHITVELIQGWLDTPSDLDRESDDFVFVEAFYKYYDWYWRERRSI